MRKSQDTTSRAVLSFPLDIHLYKKMSYQQQLLLLISGQDHWESWTEAYLLIAEKSCLSIATSAA